MNDLQGRLVRRVTSILGPGVSEDEPHPDVVRIVEAVMAEIEVAISTEAKRHDMPDTGALLERMRLIALVMHGLGGYADACEDSGQHNDAAMVRESIDEVRALLPDAANPAGIGFEWATRFTSVTGREFVTPVPCELSVTPPESSRWALMRRVVGPWVEVPAGVEAVND